jgi:hypothetical protein
LSVLLLLAIVLSVLLNSQKKKDRQHNS